MNVVVEVRAEGPERPPAGAPIRVEIRDTSFADAPAEIIASATGEVRGQLGEWLETIELEAAAAQPHATVYVHVDVDRDGRVSPGDFVTMASFPVPTGEGQTVPVSVRKV